MTNLKDLYLELIDEESDLALRIYKGATIVMFWLYLVAGVVMCFVGWAEELWWTDSAFLDGLICLVGGVVAAVGHMVCNMLMIQLLRNIQTIREKLEKAE